MPKPSEGITKSKTNYHIYKDTKQGGMMTDSLKQSSPLQDIPTYTAEFQGVGYFTVGYGYWCQVCGCWINWGCYHVCPTALPRIWYYPIAPPSDEICPDCGKKIEHCPTCGKMLKDK